MLYTPLLPGAGAGTLEPRHVVVPLREHLECTDLLLGSVTGADPDRREVSVTTADGDERTVGYDQLIVALGAISRALPIPGLREHALGFKTLSDAIAMRNKIIQTLELAEAADDEAARRALLTYVFVGAGYAGLEGCAELQDFAANVLEHYPRSRVHGLRFILVEARERVMPEISAELAEFATAELRKRGHRGPDLDHGRADLGRLGRAVGRRAGAVPDRRMDGRRAPGARGREARAAARRDGTDRGRPLLPGRGAHGRVGDRRLGRGARSRAARTGDAADLPARAAPGPHGGRQRRRRAGRRAAEAVHLQDARRVRRHGPPEGGGRDAGDQVARVPGVVPRPHLPHDHDAGGQATAAARGRLDRGPRVRSRRLGARAARAPAGARDAAHGRRGGRTVAR